MLKISTIIVCYNRKNELKECISSILNQSRLPDEIIVVDNNSTDGTETLFENGKISPASIIKYFKLDKNLGVAGGRNFGIKKASGDICLIVDDDVIYKKNAFNEIINAFKEYQEADIITFQIETPDGKPFKKYPQKSFWHKIMSLMGVSSIELAFKRKSIINASLKFDEDFGLGAKYPSGEEFIFLADTLKKRLKILYVPIPIGIHPKESSGRNFTKKLAGTKGVIFARVFGYKAFLINILFSLKKHYEYKNKISFSEFNKLSFKGTLDYLKENKNVSKNES